MINNLPEKTIIGGTVKVEFYPDRVVRIPLRDTDEVIAEEIRTIGLLAECPGMADHRPKLLAVKMNSVELERIRGFGLLEAKGVWEEETPATGEQLVRIVANLHRFGVIIHDVPDFGSGEMAYIQKADRLLVDTQRILAGRVVDVDCNNFSSVRLAEEIRLLMVKKMQELEEVERLVTLHELGKDERLVKSLKETIGLVRYVPRRKHREAIEDLERFKSVSGFFKTAMGIRPDDYDQRIEKMEMVEEVRGFWNNYQLSGFKRQKIDHPRVHQLCERMGKFEEINFAKMYSRAKRGEEIEGLDKLWGQYQEIKAEVTEMLEVMENVPGTDFQSRLAGDIREKLGKFKGGNDRMSRHAEETVKKIESGPMSTEKIKYLRELLKFSDPAILTTMLNDWKLAVVVNAKLLAKYYHRSYVDSETLVASGEVILQQIAKEFEGQDMVSNKIRCQVVGKIEREMNRLLGLYSYDWQRMINRQTV